MNRTAVVVLTFVGVFLAGGISGGFVGTRLAENWAHRRSSEMFVQQQLKRLADQLSLTPEQRQGILTIITKASQDVQEHRREISSIIDKMEGDVRLQLTENQRGEYDLVRTRMRDNEKLFQRWVREQRARRLEGQTLTGPETPPPAR